MKSIYILCFIFAIGLQLSGQYVDNKLDIYAGGGISVPLSKTTLVKENFVYPALFGNFSKAFIWRAGFSYWLTNKLSVGLDYASVNYNQWNGDEELFILTSPVLQMQILTIHAGYYPDFLKFYRIPGKIGIIAGTELCQQSLSWSEFSYSFYHPNTNTLPLEEISFCPGIKAGLRYSKELSFNTGIQIDLAYSYRYTPSLYYIEKSFHSLDFSIIIFFRGMKNRYYNYV
jgi:hypothetical protein